MDNPATPADEDELSLADLLGKAKLNLPIERMNTGQGVFDLGGGAVPMTRPIRKTPDYVLSADDLRARVSEVNRKRAERDAMVTSLAKLEKSLRMRNPEGRNALVGPDMSEPGMFRITRFDKAGAPFNHSSYGTYEQAIEDALREGYSK